MIYISNIWSLFKWLITISTLIINKYTDGRKYNYNSTAEQVIGNMNLSGKVIIVTGANRNIGLYTVKVLLSRGAKVIIADKANDISVRKQIIDYNPILLNKLIETNLDIIELDLESFESIDGFCKIFVEKYAKLNYLILNAATGTSIKWSSTKDGIEKTFGVNHIGHYYLTMKLTPLLIKSSNTNNTQSERNISRVISVTSNITHWRPQNITKWLINDKKIQNKKTYEAIPYYAFSKLCNMLFAAEYNNQFGINSNVYAVSVSPGIVGTSLRVTNTFRIFIKYIATKLFLKSLSQGSATIIRSIALSDKEFIQYGGQYFCDCNPILNDKLQSHIFLNGEPQLLLWNLSNNIIKQKWKQCSIIKN